MSTPVRRSTPTGSSIPNCGSVIGPSNACLWRLTNRWMRPPPHHRHAPNPRSRSARTSISLPATPGRCCTNVSARILRNSPASRRPTAWNCTRRWGGHASLGDRRALQLVVGLKSECEVQCRQDEEQPDTQGVEPSGPGLSDGGQIRVQEQNLYRGLLPAHESASWRAQSDDGHGPKDRRHLLS